MLSGPSPLYEARKQLFTSLVSPGLAVRASYWSTSLVYGPWLVTSLVTRLVCPPVWVEAAVVGTWVVEAGLETAVVGMGMVVAAGTMVLLGLGVEVVEKGMEKETEAVGAVVLSGVGVKAVGALVEMETETTSMVAGAASAPGVSLPAAAAWSMVVVEMCLPAAPATAVALPAAPAVVAINA